MSIPSRNRLLALSIAGLVILSACRSSTESGDGEAAYRCSDCNLVLISIDTLRADRLSLYGYDRPTSPYLEELAREAVVFEQMVNNGGGTLPVHISMMTSLLPAVHDVTPRSERVLEPERITLAEQLAERGFRTAAFTDAGWVRARFGFGQGFEVFDDKGGRFAKILPKALDWLDRSASSPFFLFLHTYDTHSEWQDQPYDCPGRYPDLYTDSLATDFTGCVGKRCASQLLLWFNEQIRAEESGFDLEEYLDADDLRFVEARYDGCINYVDDQLRGFLDELKTRGLYDDTLIVVTSDHGEEFLEHGRLLHQNKPYEELVRIPLILKLPRSEFAGERVSHLSSTIDIMPTVLDVLDVEPDPQVMGVSLMPMLTQGRPVRRSVPIFSSIRTERWKFMPIRDASLLYDLHADPGEQRNVLADHPDLVERFRAESKRATEEHKRLLQAFEEGVEQQEKLELSQEEIDDLKALGYLQ